MASIEDDDDYYDGDHCEDDDYDDGDFYDDDLDGGEATSVEVKKPFLVLPKYEIQQRQLDEISHVSVTLSISTDESSKLLNYYNWNVSQLHDEWFADEDKVRAKVGLLPRAYISPMVEVPLTTCGICFEIMPTDDEHFYPTNCGHLYCVGCWKQYISTSIYDGPGCLSLRCPEPDCRAAIVDDEMVGKLVSDEERIKYNEFLIRSYVDVSKRRKWCPSPDCENAVEFDVGSECFDVTCLCSYGFCWNCTEEIHRPVACDLVGKWVLKNSSESENTAWIIANSKACPKCKRYIEKNQGCMHMTCTPPCKFEFCWLCLGPWSAHGEKTGGFYACNTYQVAKEEGLYNDEDKKREMAKVALDKYTHYYERWAANHKSRQLAVQDLHKLHTVALHKLSDKLKLTMAQLDFIVKAWELVIECRRVLKWTYAYGYYLPDGDHPEKTFFEYRQGEAEAYMERLHQCAEEELSAFLKIIYDEEGVRDYSELEALFSTKSSAGDKKYPPPQVQLQLSQQQKETEDQPKLVAEDQRKLEEEAQRKMEADFKAFSVKIIELTKVAGHALKNLVSAVEKDLVCYAKGE